MGMVFVMTVTMTIYYFLRRRSERWLRQMKRNTFWSWFWVALGVLYFFVPLIATFDFSLRAKKGVLSFPGLSTTFLKTRLSGRPFTFSLEMAVLTIIFSILLVVPTAYWIRLRLPQLRVMVEFITMLPFVIPAIVLVFGLIRVFSGAPFFLTNTFFGTERPAGGGLYRADFALYVPLGGYRAGGHRCPLADGSGPEPGRGLGHDPVQGDFSEPAGGHFERRFLTLATVVGEFTIASFLVGINAFGPYMSLIGQNKTYESSSLAIISFLVTWAFLGLMQLFNRGKAEVAWPGRANRISIINFGNQTVNYGLS